MKETRNFLTTLFTAVCVVALGLYVCGEYLDMDLAVLSDASAGTRFALQTVAILLSLAVAPLSLRLFSLPKVRSDLMAHKASALRKWGSLRILMLGGALICNTALYYMFAYEPAFGYLAVMTALAMPFVFCTEDTEKTEDTEPCGS